MDNFLMLSHVCINSVSDAILKICIKKKEKKYVKPTFHEISKDWEFQMDSQNINDPLGLMNIHDYRSIKL